MKRRTSMSDMRNRHGAQMMRLAVSVPAICTSYKDAVKDVCGRVVYVGKKEYARMRSLQKRLDNVGVAYDVYAYTVVRQWWEWCKSKGMHSVPVNVFCGNKAFDRFTETLEWQPTVSMETRADAIDNVAMHNELTAARMFVDWTIRGIDRPIREARKRLSALTGPAIMDPSDAIIVEVCGLLGNVYGCTNARTYDDIADWIVCHAAIH
jgi:hypothetical protein